MKVANNISTCNRNRGVGLSSLPAVFQMETSMVGFQWKVDITYIYVYMDFALQSWLSVLNQELNSLDLIPPMRNNTTHNIGLNANFLKELKGGFAYKNV